MCGAVFYVCVEHGGFILSYIMCFLTQTHIRFFLGIPLATNLNSKKDVKFLSGISGSQCMYFICVHAPLLFCELINRDQFRYLMKLREFVLLLLQKNIKRGDLLIIHESARSLHDGKFFFFF